MAEPALGVARGDGCEGVGDGAFEGVAGADRFGAQVCFQLGPGLLDGVHVWGIGGEITVADPGLVERTAHDGCLVGGQVVHHYDRVGPGALKGGDEHLGDKGQEHRRAGCPCDRHGGA